jgi:hypothetical protein
MPSPVLSRRKWKLHAHDQQIVVVNGLREKFTHPLMKALLWALYMPMYPNISIEIRIGDKYKPDVVAFEEYAELRGSPPVFWGEAGQVGADKIKSIARRYPNTHFAVAKWDVNLHHYEIWLAGLLDGIKRNAPFDLISFPEDTIACIDDDGNISITFDDITYTRFEPS